MFANFDFNDLLRIFNANSVKYLVIGGYALFQYTEPRLTKTLDLLTGTDISNASAVFKALREFGAPLSGMTEDDFAEEGYFYQMGVSLVRIDVFMGIPGIEFEAAWERRMETDVNGLIVPYISREDLITAKLASGRPQDLIDVQNLSETNQG